MKNILSLVLLISATFAVTPVKLFTIEESETVRLVWTESIIDQNDNRAYYGKLIGDTLSTFVDFDLYHLERGLVQTYRIPSKYNGGLLRGVYVGFTNGNEDPAFTYDGNGTGVLLDHNLNEILSITAENSCYIQCFMVNGISYVSTRERSNDYSDKETYYKLRDDITPIISQSFIPESNIDLSFLQNGEIANISNLETAAELNVFDTRGRVIHSTSLEQHSSSVALPPMAAGVYIGRVEGLGGATSTTPFVKN